MFAKKKKGLFDEVNDENRIVNDFMLRITRFFESYRTVDYHLSARLDEDAMIPYLDKRIDALFAGDAIDPGNGNALDTVILGVAKEAEDELLKQRVTHDDLIRRFIVRRKADHKDLVQIEDTLKKELASLEEEFHTICEDVKKEKEAAI